MFFRTKITTNLLPCTVPVHQAKLIKRVHERSAILKNKSNTWAFCFSVLTGRSPRVSHWDELIGKVWEKEMEHCGKEGRVWERGNDSKREGGRKEGRKVGTNKGMNNGVG